MINYLPKKSNNFGNLCSLEALENRMTSINLIKIINFYSKLLITTAIYKIRGVRNLIQNIITYILKAEDHIKNEYCFNQLKRFK